MMDAYLTWELESVFLVWSTRKEAFHNCSIVTLYQNLESFFF